MSTSLRHPPVRHANAARLALIAAALLAASLTPAFAGVSWVDNPHESVVVPLESPNLGISRARWHLEQKSPERAIAALKKVIARFPTATEAHRLLADIYRNEGKTELAEAHALLARQSG